MNENIKIHTEIQCEMSVANTFRPRKWRKKKRKIWEAMCVPAKSFNFELHLFMNANERDVSVGWAAPLYRWHHKYDLKISW